MNKFFEGVEQFKGYLGDKAYIPLVDLMRHYLPDVDSTFRDTFEAEFEGLMKRLDLAEAVGKTRLERLNKEIEEWYEIVGDEDTISLHTSVFNRTPLELIEKYVRGENVIIMALDIVKIDDEYKDDVGDWLTSFMINYLNTDSPEAFIRAENIDAKYHLLTQEQYNQLPIADKIKIFGQMFGAPPVLIVKIYSGLVDALRFTHQTAYFHRLIAYKNNITKQEPIEASQLTETKALTIQLPKIKQRAANDGITSLSLNQTALLFNSLRKARIIFKDESYQTKENIYKAIQVLTGYSKQNLKVDMNLKEYEQSDKDVVQNIIKKLKI